MADDVIALKPYLDQIRALCANCSREELVELLAKLAAQQPARDRGRFLEQLQAMAGMPPVESVDTEESDQLLQEIDELLQEVQERIASIEDGSIYEEEVYQAEETSWRGGPYYDYDDDGPPALTEDQEERLAELFGRTGGHFLNRDFALAAKAYQKLLGFFDLEYVVTLEVDRHEVKARYGRAILESTLPERRVAALVEALLAEDAQQTWTQAWREPRLCDFLSACEGTIEHWDAFLKDWKRVVKAKAGPQAAILLLEAIEATEGIAAVRQFAREHRERVPLGFVYWIEAERAASGFVGMKEACLEALTSVPRKETQDPYQPVSEDLRVHFAKSLLAAGEALKEDETILVARRSLFHELQNDAALRELLHQAEATGRWDAELSAACEFLHSQKQLTSLRLKADLMRGDWKEVSGLSENRKPEALGWSSPDSWEGLYLASLLAALCREKAGTTKAVRALLHRYADEQFRTYGEPSVLESGDELNAADIDVEAEGEANNSASSNFYTDHILAALQRYALAPERWDEYYRRAKAHAERRIRSILDGRMRGAYDRAAELLVALAETRSLHGDPAGARSLIHEYVKIKYNRLSAFKRELARYPGWGSA